MINQVFTYQLKRRYGQKAVVRHHGPVVVDTLTGTENSVVVETVIDRIIPPPPGFKLETAKAMQLEGMKFGGEATVLRQVFLVDKKDLVEPIKQGDEIIFNGRTYQVVSGTDFSKGNLLEVIVEGVIS